MVYTNVTFWPAQGTVQGFVINLLPVQLGCHQPTAVLLDMHSHLVHQTALAFGNNTEI